MIQGLAVAVNAVRLCVVLFERYAYDWSLAFATGICLRI